MKVTNFISIALVPLSTNAEDSFLVLQFPAERVVPGVKSCCWSSGIRLSSLASAALFLKPLLSIPAFHAIPSTWLTCAPALDSDLVLLSAPVLPSQMHSAQLLLPG